MWSEDKGRDVLIGMPEMCFSSVSFELCRELRIPRIA